MATIGVLLIYAPLHSQSEAEAGGARSPDEVTGTPNITIPPLKRQISGDMSAQLSDVRFYFGAQLIGVEPKAGGKN